MYSALRPLLFRLDAETAHHLTLRALEGASALPGWAPLARRWTAPADPRLRRTLWAGTAWERSFASPVGLAAGLDKNAQAIPAFGALGFGFLEVGTVTPRPQAGNPRPRLFRLPEDAALINRMGFNNAGAAALRERLGRLPLGARPVPVWVNIGKNKDTPNEAAAEDYRACVRSLQALADAFVVNVSSPNTPGLRALQSADDLGALVRAVVSEVEAGRTRTLNFPPVLVKLAPDLHPADFEASVGAALEAGAAGLILTNTTLGREGLHGAARGEAGGLSGEPLRERSTTLIREAARLTGGRVPLVGVGGVGSARDVLDKLEAGASLVELYSALVYGGPGLVGRIHRDLLAAL